MPKYIRRSSSNARSSSDTLRDTLLRELEKEGEKLLKRMVNDFTRDLEKEGSRVLQGLLGGTGKGNEGLPGLDSATQLLGALVNYAVSKPHTSTSTVESDRSKQAAASFRVSRAQAMAEATSELARSERNL